MGDAPQSYPFKAEVEKLLSIITHSLYTNREIFLRELISNASDALDKLRFEQSKGGDVAAPDLELGIDISVDKDARKLVIADTGLGMTEDEIKENIGTIAHSGTEAFLERMAEAKNSDQASDIIGRFGVGFYSVFMVADEVAITTRSAQPEAEPVLWRSTGAGSFEVQAISPDQAPERGTRIEITVKEDADEFLDSEQLKSVIKTHSSFISFPISVDGETVNTIPALWREPKFSIKPEQYKEFYNFLTFDSDEPLITVHVSVDAPVQFTALLFIPKQSRDFFGSMREERGLDLYVRRVLIMRSNKDLVPEHLAFLRGLVDTEDLPLNVSRESLQENVLLRKIASTVTKQVLSELEKTASQDKDKYEEFWRAHGRVLTLGYGDFANRERIGALLRFNSSWCEDAKGLTSLDDYISRMKPGQKDIYFVSAPSREAAAMSPHLEFLRQRSIEVLYLLDPVEEFAMDALGEYKEHKLVSAEHADPDAVEAVQEGEDKKEKPKELDDEGKAALDSLVARFKEVLGNKVTDVRVSQRLTDSPCCLANPEGMTSSMERLMRMAGKEQGAPAKAMELNPDHPLIRTLLRVHQADPEDPHVARNAELMHDAALLQEGYVADPHKTVERLNQVLEQAGAWYAEIKKV